MKVTSLLGSLAPTIISSILEALFGAFHLGLTKATCSPRIMEFCQLNAIVCLSEALVCINNKAFLASFTEAA